MNAGRDSRMQRPRFESWSWWSSPMTAPFGTILGWKDSRVTSNGAIRFPNSTRIVCNHCLQHESLTVSFSLKQRTTKILPLPRMYPLFKTTSTATYSSNSLYSFHVQPTQRYTSPSPISSRLRLLQHHRHLKHEGLTYDAVNMVYCPRSWLKWPIDALVLLGRCLLADTRWDYCNNYSPSSLFFRRNHDSRMLYFSCSTNWCYRIWRLVFVVVWSA